MRFFWVPVLLFCSTFSFAQSFDNNISVTETERIVKTLSADDMQGRKPFTPGIDKAAAFISSEFKRTGLEFFPGLDDYRQPFSLVRAKFISATGTINSIPIEEKDIIAVTQEASLEINENSGYRIIPIDSSAAFTPETLRILKEKKNTVVLIRSFHAASFNRLKRFKRESFKQDFSVLFVLTDLVPEKFSFSIKHDISSTTLANVVGVLPGRSKKDEVVVFSGHYDHLGIGKPNSEMDSVYNGANDDASGTAAVIMLADYFGKQRDNERTIVFVAFTAEESGGYGSRYFSSMTDPDKTIAMFNIEMIGTESKWGRNSAYITGYEKSDFGKILQHNLENSPFHFEPDPYPAQNLFYRSDNATLASLGVPAHTISTSKMDSEKYYHTQEDEIETLDLENMTEIIRAIALSSKSVIAGNDTPARVEKMEK